MDELELLRKYDLSGDSMVLPAVPSPSFLEPKGTSVRTWHSLVQRVLDSFGYNQITHEMCSIDKNMPFWHVILCAQTLWLRGLPMKCLEACALSVALTNPTVLAYPVDYRRFPLRFKSRSNGRSYWHIVLGVKYGSLYGSLGLSRSCLVSHLCTSLLTALVPVGSQTYQVSHTLLSR